MHALFAAIECWLVFHSKAYQRHLHRKTGCRLGVIR